MLTSIRGSRSFVYGKLDRCFRTAIASFNFHQAYLVRDHSRAAPVPFQISRVYVENVGKRLVGVMREFAVEMAAAT
jgi:hypothetical protein